jgi:phospho-N-acetylmuramoyl-pentapeptide-transferase
MLVTTLWLGLIGGADDYIKVYKKDKEGLHGKFKIVGQVGLGLIIGITLWQSDAVVIREKVNTKTNQVIVESETQTRVHQRVAFYSEEKSTKTTIPFLKGHEFDYAKIIWFMGDQAQKWKWLVFIVIIIFIITAVSNGANITDGLDGLATGTSAIIGATLGILAYVSGNMIFADYLNIMYIPKIGELVVFASAFIGATVGFLWYNSYPAQVFMGDTGSLALGGIIAVFAILIRKELLIPILCGIFLVENLSVMMQVSYFKYTKKKYGEGRRIFKMSPLHHHYQKLGYPESKIVTRFWIVGILLAIITIITLKTR